MILLLNCTIFGCDHNFYPLDQFSAKLGPLKRCNYLPIYIEESVVCLLIVFLAVQNSSIGDLVPCLVRLTPLTIRVFTTLQSDPRDLWPLRHVIRVMKGHDLTNKKTMTNTNTKTMTMTKTNTFWEHLQRATLETCDLWDIWSEWW